MRALVLILSLSTLLLAAPAAPAKEPLVADLSRHLVAITTGFAGTDLLLFGAIDGDGDVVVVVRGPSRAETVWRKDRQFGIWVNAGSARAVGAPSFYRVAANRPLADFAPPALLERHQIGLDHLTIEIRGNDRATSGATYREALMRLKKAAGLYGDRTDDIGFLGHRLFRTDVHFPANVPVGTYLVEVYLIANGEVVSAQTTPLVVSTIGIGADIAEFAHRQSALYGIIAVLLAAAAGWAAAAVLRK